MFAPHCPRCCRRVLLGTRRIVHFSWSGEGERVVTLRCHCGELLDSGQGPPPAIDGHQPMEPGTPLNGPATQEVTQPP